MEELHSLLKKMALYMERAENKNIFFQGTTKFSTPLTINSIRIQTVAFKKEQPCKYVAVRPVDDEKTYIGILIGEATLSGGGLYNIENQEIFMYHILNPVIFIPDLMRVVSGIESWWDFIKKPKDLRQITDVDIQNVWYVKALKSMHKDSVKTGRRCSNEVTELGQKSKSHWSGCSKLLHLYILPQLRYYTQDLYLTKNITGCGVKGSIQKVSSSNCSVCYSCDYLRHQGIFINYNSEFILCLCSDPFALVYSRYHQKA
jgi:hypothetical protein